MIKIDFNFKIIVVFAEAQMMKIDFKNNFTQLKVWDVMIQTPKIYK